MFFSRVLLAGALLTLSGCRVPRADTNLLSQRPSFRTAPAAREAIGDDRRHELSDSLQLASLDEPDDESSPNWFMDDDDPFAGREELPLGDFVAAVQARNPSLQAAQAAWQAAANKCPQAIALDDPMFQSMLAPRSLASSSNVAGSYYVGVAQKLPWAGKRALRGDQANWEASASGFDAGEVQLKITEAARLAYFDYYLNQRERELNAASREALRGFRDIARAKYEANQVTQQDVLQAEVELAQQDQRRIELSQERIIAVARINTLLHRRPDHRLPIPPNQLPVVVGLPPVESLREWAVEHRPELQALAARTQAEQSAVALACKEFYPDVELMGRYDRFWFDSEQRAQVGLNANVPLNRSKRHAAVQEALWRVHKMQADYDQAADTVRGDVQAAYARVRGGQRQVELFETKILPAAEENRRAAQSGYEAGTVDFLRLIEAQRQVLDLREKHQMAIADFHRRTAELERAVGGDVLSRDRVETAPASETTPKPVNDR